MAGRMQVVVNGQVREVPATEPAMLAEVLAALDLKADRIAVEHNGKISRRTAWGETPVQSGDRLEIVHFVGGGCGKPLDIGI